MLLRSTQTVDKDLLLVLIIHLILAKAEEADSRVEAEGEMVEDLSTQSTTARKNGKNCLMLRGMPLGQEEIHEEVEEAVVEDDVTVAQSMI